MNKRLRRIPYPVGSERRREAIATALRYGWAKTYREAVAQVVAANNSARNTPRYKERCEARTRRGTACQCKALANGRCKLHGGMSTGPKTAEGKKRSAANLPKADRSAQAGVGLCGPVRAGARQRVSGPESVDHPITPGD